MPLETTCSPRVLAELKRADGYRLLSGSTLARPTPVRTRQGQWRRDPAGEWDWYYQLEQSARSWISRNLMSPTGCSPDEMAGDAGFDYVDQWAEKLVQAVDLVRSRALRDVDPLAAEYDQGGADPYELLGPEEVSELLHVARNTLAQWRHRGLLPAPDLELSGMQIWERHTVTEWAALTGREIVESEATQ